MHKAIIATVLLAFACAALPAATEANWNKIIFTDGQARSIDDFAGQTTAIFAFCRG